MPVAETPRSIWCRSFPGNHAAWLRPERRVVKMGREQAVECDLHQQIGVEFGKDPKCVARALWSELPVPQPRNQRIKVPCSHEPRCQLERRPILG